jgi:hypothetical protein
VPSEKENRLSSSFTSALHLAARLPGWMVLGVALVAVAITAVVAGYRHTAAEGLTSSSAQGGHITYPDLRPSSRAQAREAPISRAAIRRGHASVGRHRGAVARPGALTRTPARHEVQVVEAAAPLKRKPAPPPVPITSRDAAQTVASAEASTTNVPGHCLAWSRERADVPSRYPDAATAWVHATGRHPGNQEPPRGAAVYWTGGSSGYGHIAISVGNGKVRSPDAGGSGSVATVPLRSIARKWHLEYAGWANSINGYTIPGVAHA